MKIVIKTTSGRVEIMTPIFPTPPLITEEVDEEIVEREMTNEELEIWQGEFIDARLQEWKDFNEGLYVSHRAMPDEAIPTDRTFRDAWSDTTQELVIDIDLARAKTAKIASFAESFEQAAAQITAGYPASEIVSWPTQEKEALAWDDDNNVLTPYIDALATARGISRTVYLTKTVQKIVAFRAATATIIGKRQRLEDQAKAASTIEQLAAIVW